MRLVSCGGGKTSDRCDCVVDLAGLEPETIKAISRPLPPGRGFWRETFDWTSCPTRACMEGAATFLSWCRQPGSIPGFSPWGPLEGAHGGRRRGQKRDPL